MCVYSAQVPLQSSTPLRTSCVAYRSQLDAAQQGSSAAMRRIGPGVVTLEPSPGRHGAGGGRGDKRSRITSSSGSGLGQGQGQG